MSGAAVCLPPSAIQRSLPASSGWVEVRAAEIAWTVDGVCVDELLGRDGLRWDEWRRSDAVEIVKTGPHRTVYRLRLSAGEFYIKHFRAADWKAWLRNLVRLSPAERELRAVQRLASLRLATFTPIALGRRVGLLTGDTWLVSRAIPDTSPLDHHLLTEFAMLGPRCQATMRQRIATELGRLAARLHAAGIEHIDLHAGNLLIRPSAGPGEPLLSLIDLHSVRFHQALSRRQRERNLAALHQFFANRSTRADRRRFWRAYRNSATEETTASSPAVTLAGETEATRMERVLQQSAQAGWRRADRAWRRGNRHVRKLDRGASRSRGLATLDEAALTAIRESPESLFERGLIRWCKRTARRRVAEVAAPFLRGIDDGCRAFWKCIAARRGIVDWFAPWRLSPVRRAWEVGHALLRRGIDTPRPLLYVETATPHGRQLYLLTEAVEGSHTAQELFARSWPEWTNEQRTRWLQPRLRQLGGQLRRLHDSGFDHRDLKFPNLLVSADDDHRVWLLDLDAVRKWPVLPRFRAAQNLGRLNVSSLLLPEIRHTDRLRFLRWYLGVRFDADWKSWWRSVSRRSISKIARNHRRARPLS